jgi:hypothetical protein
MPFAIEKILDENVLYMRVNRSNTPKGKVSPSVFISKGNDGVSVDWCRYSTPADSLLRSRVPEDNGILSIKVASVREIENLDAVHDPVDLPDNINQSHSLITGIPPEPRGIPPISNEALRIRTLLLLKTKVEIDPEAGEKLELNN